jgi:uncharacterized membrane-anchored protein YitT (DUF2179 family)
VQNIDKIKTYAGKIMNRISKIKWSEFFSDLVVLIGGALLFGVGMNMFITPGQVILGGCTGIASTINYFFPNIPIGMMIMLLNLPLVLLNMKEAGLKALVRTILGIAATSVLIDVIVFIPDTLLPRTTDPLMCAVIGGAVQGAASGFLLTRGFSTGGTDLASYMLNRKYRMFSAGHFLLAIDCAVVLGSAIVTGRYKGLVYSIICLTMYSIAMDLVLGGSDKAKSMLIFSGKYALIADAITKQYGRGVTVLFGRGWYTKEERNVLMCVVKRTQEYRVRSLIRSIDPDAFIIISDATQVLGYGFKPNE